MRTSIVIAVGLALGACSDPYANVKDMLASGAREPDRVQFDQLHDGADGRICGRINQPNSLGGMTGFTRFVYYVEEDRLHLSVPTARVTELAQRPLRDRMAAIELEELRSQSRNFQYEHGRHCAWAQFN